MADQTVVHIGENSPEQVAYKLLSHVAASEGVHLRVAPSEKPTPDRKWILDTFAECLHAARGFRDLPKT